MKKTIFTLLLAIAAVFSIQAQSITGKSWAAALDDGQGHDLKMVMEFESESQCMVALFGEVPMVEDGVKINVSVQAAVPGTYTVSGKKLDVKLSSSSAHIDIDASIGNMGGNESVKKQAASIIKGELEKQKKEILSGLMECVPNLKNATIKSVTDSQLVLVEAAGQEMQFVAVH